MNWKYKLILTLIFGGILDELDMDKAITCGVSVEEMEFSWSYS